MPDIFTPQVESAATQWVNVGYPPQGPHPRGDCFYIFISDYQIDMFLLYHRIVNPLSCNAFICTVSSTGSGGVGEYQPPTKRGGSQ